MKTTNLLTLSLAAFGLGGSAFSAPAAAAPQELFPGDPPACEAAALAAREASRHEIRSDFWLKVANYVNHPSGKPMSRLRDALAEREAALAMAEEQYRVRRETCEQLGHGTYDPLINPSEFSAARGNRYLPLLPGRTLVYEKQTADGLERVEMRALDKTRKVNGVECQVIHAHETLDGVLVENTIEWFAQHANGDIWYFGEVAQHFEHGFLDNLDGSWRAGKDGARPGILMLADPVVGQTYRQEFLVNRAEDVAKVIGLGATVQGQLGTYEGCLQTLEWSPMEPDDVVVKCYAPDVGLVKEIDLVTGATLELVEIK